MQNIQSIFSDIANAIRDRLNVDNYYTPYEFPDAINSIFIQNTLLNTERDYFCLMNNTLPSISDYVEYQYNVTAVPGMSTESVSLMPFIFGENGGSIYIGNNITDLSYVMFNHYLYSKKFYFGNNHTANASQAFDKDGINLAYSFATTYRPSYYMFKSINFYAIDDICFNNLVGSFQSQEITDFYCNQNMLMNSYESSCENMFYGSSLSKFSTKNYISSGGWYNGMFGYCNRLTTVNSNFVFLPSVATDLHFYGENMFVDCSNLNSPINIIKMEGTTTKVNALFCNGMFASCHSLNSPINFYGISNETNIFAYSMFYGCYNFNGNIHCFTDLGEEINILSINDGGSMFSFSNFNTDINIKMTGTNYSYMFDYCNNLNANINFIINEEENELIDMHEMFSGCSNLSHFTLNNKARIIAENMFNQCTKLEQINFADQTTFTSAARMFNNCTSLFQIDINNLNIQNALGMFTNCSNIQQLNLNNINIMYPNYMFANCNQLISINIENINIDSHSDGVTDMFYNCNNLKMINISNSLFTYTHLRIPGYITNLNIINTNFQGSLITLNKNFNFNFYNSTISSITALFQSSIYNAPVNFSNCIINYANIAFNNCLSFNQPIIFDNVYINNAAMMFNNCNNFNTSITFGNNVTLIDAQLLFAQCKKLNYPIDIPEDTFINNTAYMFRNCSNLRQVNMYIQNNIYNTQYMFSNCSSYLNCNLFFKNGLNRPSALENIFNTQSSRLGWFTIYCNDLTPFRNSDNRMVGRGTAITWTTITNGYTNTGYHIRLYNNCP